MRFPDPTRFVPALVRLGWLTTTVPNPAPARACGRAFLLRGQAVVFSGGFGPMCDGLRRQGVWAEDLRCRGETWACKQVIADHRAGRGRPVALVGHSCGGRSALFAAEALRAAGVGVDLVVCLDVTLPPPVPANVRRAIHLRWTGWRLYPAGTLVPAPGASPLIENIDLGAAGAPVSGAGYSHMTLTGSPAVQEYVVRRVLEAAQRGG